MSKGTRYPHVEYYLSRFTSPGGRVLEIGCGAARYRNFFSSSRYFGCDVPNPHYQDWDSVDLYTRAEKLPFSNESFDLVFSQAVIDYVLGIEEMLLESRRILKTDGKMLIFTYNKKTLERIHRGAFNAKYQAQKHYHVFNETELLSLLHKSGFKGKILPHIVRPYLFFMPLLSGIPVIRDLISTCTSWRSFLAWK